MASNAIRAKATLPALRPAAHPRNSRTPGRRGAGASSPGTADTSGARWRARSCGCYARASFASRYVSSERPWGERRLEINNDLRRRRSAGLAATAASLLFRLLRRCILLVRGREGSQGVPARVGGNLRGAAAIAGVEVRATGRTQTLAIVLAEQE